MAELENLGVMGFFSRTHDDVRSFRDVLVHPSQEMRDPDGAFFRGGPAWPRFQVQVLPRQCRGAFPRPVDSKPAPAIPEWPYFDPLLLPLFWPQLGIDRRLPPEEQRRAIAALADAHAPRPDQLVDSVETGIWCGPISLHFGETINAFGMRIAGSSLIDDTTPLVFSLAPFCHFDPQPFFWDMLDHLGVERRRVLLIRAPTRFARLSVVPQAERFYGGGPTARHLRLMDEIIGHGPDRDVDCVFVSRARMPDGRFAGESYLDEVLAAAGVTVFHPETSDLPAQLRLYRRARRLIFSEGSALHTLQLLGHLDCDLIVLVRRPGYRISLRALRPRARTLRYVEPRGLVYGLSSSGHPILRAGITVLDDALLMAELKSLGIDLGPWWDATAYAARRDGDIAAWLAARDGPQRHPGDRALVERGLRRLALRA